MEKEEKQRRVLSYRVFVLLVLLICVVLYRFEINNGHINSDKEIGQSKIDDTVTTAIVNEDESENTKSKYPTTSDNIEQIHIPYLPLKHQTNTMGMNILDGKSYEHHPVLLQIPITSYYFSPDKYMVELNGLKVPVTFDCNNLNQHHAWNKKTNNFLVIPSRWHSCYVHEAVIKSGMDQEIPQLPIIDEEYPIMVSVLQSTLRAKNNFIMAEVGASWGTWGARAIKNLLTLNVMEYNLFFIEPDKKNCEGIEEVMKLNTMKYELSCNGTDFKSFSKKFSDWASSKQHIDLVNFDISSGENYLISDLKDVMDSKTYRIIIRTHDKDSHDDLKKFYEDWIVIFDMPVIKPQCTEKVELYLRGQYDENNVERFQWWKLIDDYCYNPTTWGGKITNWDGILIIDNVKYVFKDKIFSLSDTVLKTNDLK